MKSMSRFQSVRKLNLLFIFTFILIPYFQNCSPSFKSSTSDPNLIDMSSVSNPQGSAPLVLMGKSLYSQKCSACHGVFESSSLNGRVITAEKISNAFSIISAMAPMRGQFSNEQINSLSALFSNSSVTPPNSTPVSSFPCADVESEKNNSSEMIRLTGPELKATYQSLVSPAIWTSLSDVYYLLPTDNFDGLISNFVNTFSADQVDQISRFNEKLSLSVTSSNANLSAFFGSCATSTSFTQTCFNNFLNSKGSLFFRSALAADDASRIWGVITQTTNITDQQKVAVQMLFNDPRFMYHIEFGEGVADANGLLTLSAFEIANRIAYGMTSAPADALLWADAANGNLKQLANVMTHVDRLAQTAAFKNRVIQFAKFYTGQSQAAQAPTLADFTNGLNVSNLHVDAEAEFNEYISYIIFGSRGNLKDFFSSKAAFPKSVSMASVFGTSVWSSGSPQVASNHVGILSRPYLNLNPSPNAKYVQRGRRIRINMLCTDIPQPSAADLAARPTLSEQDLISLTRRQYVDRATMATTPGTACYACHSKMNQIGFATSQYDSAGRFVTSEKIYNNDNLFVATHAIDSSSVPNITEADGRNFMTVQDFQVALAESDSLQQCFSRKTLQFFTRRSENVNLDSCRLNKIDNQIKSGTPLVDVLTTTFKNSSVLYKRSK